jgi:hypothetical protein
MSELVTARIRDHATRLALPHLTEQLDGLVARAEADTMGYLDLLDLALGEEVGVREARRAVAALLRQELLDGPLTASLRRRAAALMRWRGSPATRIDGPEGAHMSITTIIDVVESGREDPASRRWQDPDQLICPGCAEHVRPEPYLEPLGRGLGCS